jgi:hypothetical protein
MVRACEVTDRLDVMTPTVPYASLVPGFVISGIGMSLFFAPVANVVLSAVRPSEEGQASGANNAIREAGGVFGVAVLAAVFARYGGYGSGEAFVDGLKPALWIGAGVVFAGALAALAIPRLRRPVKALDVEPAVAVISRCACSGCLGPLVDPHLEAVVTRATWRTGRWRSGRLLSTS